MPFDPGILLLTWIMCFDELSALLVVQLSLCSDLHSWLNVIYYVNNLNNFLLMECIEYPDYLYIQLKNNKASLPVEWIVGKLRFLYISCVFTATLCHSQWAFQGKVTSPWSGWWMRAAGKVGIWVVHPCLWLNRQGTLQGQHREKGVELVACKWSTRLVSLHRRHIRC